MPSTTVCLEHVQVHDVCGLQHYFTGSLGAHMSHWSYQGHELAFVLETGSQGCGLATPPPCEDASLLHAMSIGVTATWTVLDRVVRRHVYTEEDSGRRPVGVGRQASAGL